MKKVILATLCTIALNASAAATNVQHLFCHSDHASVTLVRTIIQACGEETADLQVLSAVYDGAGTDAKASDLTTVEEGPVINFTSSDAVPSRLLLKGADDPRNNNPTLEVQINGCGMVTIESGTCEIL